MIKTKILIGVICVLLITIIAIDKPSQHMRVYGYIDSNLKLYVYSIYSSTKKTKTCTKHGFSYGRRLPLILEDRTRIKSIDNEFDSQIPLKRDSFFDILFDDKCEWKLQEVVLEVVTDEMIQKGSSNLHFHASKYGVREDYPEIFKYLCTYKNVKLSDKKMFVCYINGDRSNVYWLSDDYVYSGMNIDINLE